MNSLIAHELNFVPIDFRRSNESNRIALYRQFEYPWIIKEKVEYLGTLIRLNSLYLHWTIRLTLNAITFIQNNIERTIDIETREDVLEFLLMNGYITNFKLIDIHQSLVGFLMMNGFKLNDGDIYSHPKFKRGINVKYPIKKLIKIEII